MGVCHRCHKPIDFDSRVVYPFRFVVRLGQAFDMTVIKYYHRKCLPPAAFHEWKKYHEHSVDNSDGCHGAPNRVQWVVPGPPAHLLYSSGRKSEAVK